MVGSWSLLGVVFYAICKRKYKEDFGKLIELISDEDEMCIRDRDNLGMWCKFMKFSGDSVIKSGSDGEQHIAVADCHV